MWKFSPKGLWKECGWQQRKPFVADNHHKSSLDKVLILYTYVQGDLLTKTFL